ncbi:Uu.00g087370.m01.CDS01 [Anthostomella pinea]|uniref:Uu.00g087370.m01.CDS01 n=1 Tax=Anthostomella pinea TaxID=933095 RepID=A0AAI8VM91_9PEZI|nr:Uu.00g087370.m01.CDS01 [Anthostomella pinea]
MASFPSLSQEVLDMILEPLIPEPIPTDGNTADMLYDYGQSYATLYSLCTSRLWRRVAQPSLHRNVIVNQPLELLRLYRTLLGNRALRSSVRHFACLTDLVFHDQPIQENIETEWDCEVQSHADRLKAWNSATPSFNNADVNPLETKFLDDLDLADIDTLTVGHDCYLQRVTAMILVLSGGLVDFLMYVPEIDFPLDEADSDDEHPVLDSRLANTMRFGDPTCTHALRRILTRLALIRLQRSPDRQHEYAEMDWNQSYGIGINAAQIPMFGIGQTKKVEIYGDNGVWNKPTAAMECLVDLRLSFSRTSPTCICEILKFSRNLKILHCERDTHQEESEKLAWGLPPKDINEALLQGADTLQTLRLDTIAGQYLPDNAPARQATVTCLPAFENLRHLAIGLTKLLGTWTDRSDNETAYPPLSTILPKQLHTLELIERLYEGEKMNLRYDHKQADKHEQWLEIMFDGLIKECEDDQWPSLRELTFRAANMSGDSGIHTIQRKDTRTPDAILD